MWFEMEQVPLDWADEAPYSFHNEAVLEASPEEVFAIWADIDQWPRWFEDIERGAWTAGGDDPGVGSERVVHLEDMSVREYILAWEPGARFAFSITAATLPLANRIVEDYRLAPAGEGRSRFEWDVSFDLRWFVRPLGWAVRREFGAMFERATQSLREYVRTQ
jgi:uncharacterized protein YndB with AHSA1/START domain